MGKVKSQKRKGVSVYQRESDGKYVAMITLEKDPITNKKTRKALYANSDEEIYEKIDTFLFELKTGLYTPKTSDTLVTFLRRYHNVYSGCDMWKDDFVYPDKAKWAITTAELYKMYIDVHIAPYFKDIKLADIKPITLDNYYNNKLNTDRKSKRAYIRPDGTYIDHDITFKPLSNNTVRKLNTFLKAAFNYAIKNDILRDNPATKVNIAPREKYIPNIFKEEQFSALLDNIKDTNDEIPIILGGGCGMRRGEIFGLRWCDVNYKANTITIKNTVVRFSSRLEKVPKNETSERTIFAPDYVMDVIRKYETRIGKHEKSDRIITSWNPTWYSDRYKSLLKKFELPECRLHDLRHYNAVIMCKYGVSDKVAAERLGHSQVATLRNVYQHVFDDMDESAANVINNSMNRPKKEI